MKLALNLSNVETNEKDKDIQLFLAAQNKPSEFMEFFVNIKEDLMNHFGPTRTKLHMHLYKPSVSPFDWELLFELETPLRPEKYTDKIVEFNHPEFYDYPIDICKYYKVRPKINVE
jgi:hypothetical protein